MIAFDCRCEMGHIFEGLFESAQSLDTQIRLGLVTCPKCGAKAIKRLPSAPYIGKSSETALEGLPPNPLAELREKMYQLAGRIARDSVDVGENFAQEARAIHEGRSSERSIRGKCTPEDARSLLEEGIPVLPLPEDFAHEKN